MAKYARLATNIQTNLGLATLVLSTHDTVEDASREAEKKEKPVEFKATMKNKYGKDWTLDYSKQRVVQLLELPNEKSIAVETKLG